MDKTSVQDAQLEVAASKIEGLTHERAALLAEVARVKDSTHALVTSGADAKVCVCVCVS